VRRAGRRAGEIEAAAVLVDAVAAAVVTTGARRTIGIVAVGIEGEDVARGDGIAIRSDDVVRRIAVTIGVCVTPVDGVVAVGLGSRIGIRGGIGIRLGAECGVQHHALPDPGGAADEVRVVRAAVGAADLVAGGAGRAVHLGRHRVGHSRVRLPRRIFRGDDGCIEVAARDEGQRAENNEQRTALHARLQSPLRDVGGL
jgi:hypothetical protein